jgi:polyhydroxyalkanoate synthase
MDPTEPAAFPARLETPTAPARGRDIKPTVTPEHYLASPVPLAHLDRGLRAAVARASRGVAWPSLLAAYADWYWHLAAAPGKQMELVAKAQRKWARFVHYALTLMQEPCEPCIEPLPQDRRFSDPAWQEPPFNLIYQAFLLQQQWWWNATSDVKGVSAQHQRLVSFMARQWLDLASPSNFIATNPEILRRTTETGGRNLLDGAQAWWRDFLALAGGVQRPEGIHKLPGRDVAVTPGKVVYRNRLIELIQYAPATDRVFAEPVLIVPSCVLKYYILDLSPESSVVRYLVGRGHTVFVMSWLNPDVRDRELGVDDYLRLGLQAAIDTVAACSPAGRLHAVGYCLGGTFLAAVAAALGARDDKRLASVTLLAAETDFTEAGELSIFIDESQLTYLEDLTWEQGYLDGRQMAGAFLLLNSADLVWSRNVRSYLMDDPPPSTDLTSWNADTTRLPHRMHSEYMRGLYLTNDLASGRMKVDGRPIALSDIRVPVFLLGTERDHVSPWPSVYKLHLFADTEITFCLTSGGHNVGVVNPPGVPGRHYRIATQSAVGRYVDPDVWYARAPVCEGSWWPAWADWLAQRSGEQVAPPPLAGPEGQVLDDAPGTYVLVR